MRKNAKKYVTVKCNTCGNDVAKEKREYDRQTLKRGQTKFYCNNKCSYKDNKIVQEASQYSKEHPQEMYLRLSTSPNWKPRIRDAMSPFRHFVRKIRQRLHSLKNKKEFNVSASYLKKIWDKQKGICPYTNIPMILRETNGDSNLLNASLDRINSSIGYIEGNVEFVCLGINYAKNNFSKEEMMNFINLIKTGASNIS